jgi:SAM-dependent methyltransferase
MTWAEFWNRETTIYVNERHRIAHYDGVARDILSFVRSHSDRVVDYGCGDTLAADRVAAGCGGLYLCDAASYVRDRLSARYAGVPNVSVIAPEAFEGMPEGSVDLLIVNSVVQYLSVGDLDRLLAIAREKLAPGGRMVLADIVPRGVGPISDALQLLKFGAANGFLVAAFAGLVRSYFSNYRKVREGLGFLQLDEKEMLDLLAKAGFSARRHTPNMGHNARRMTFVGTPVAGR